MVLPIIHQALVEGAVLFWSDVRWFTSPDGFRLVELLLGGLYLFGLLLFLLLFLVDLLNLGLLFTFLVFFFFLIFYFLRRRLSTATYDAYT
jgi:hypothetical protein